MYIVHHSQIYKWNVCCTVQYRLASCEMLQTVKFTLHLLDLLWDCVQPIEASGVWALLFYVCDDDQQVLCFKMWIVFKTVNIKCGLLEACESHSNCGQVYYKDIECCRCDVSVVHENCIYIITTEIPDIWSKFVSNISDVNCIYFFEYLRIVSWLMLNSERLWSEDMPLNMQYKQILEESLLTENQYKKLYSLTNIIRAVQSKLWNSKNHFGVDIRYLNIYSCPYQTSFPDHP